MRIRRIFEVAELETPKRLATFDALVKTPLSEVLLVRFNSFDETAQINTRD